MRWTYLDRDFKSCDFTSTGAGFCYGSNDINDGRDDHSLSHPSQNVNSKIAAFDLDSTLIKTKSGHKFSKDTCDWMWFYPCVPNTLKQYYQKGYRILIITNQGGIKKDVLKLHTFQTKIESISKELTKHNVHFEVFCAPNNDVFRKPFPTMLSGLSMEFTKESFYCGDAAGRASDFADTDYKFAFNVTLKFYTPERLFLHDRTSNGVMNFDTPDQLSSLDYVYEPYSDKPELILMVGYPGSGKSYLANHIKVQALMLNEPIRVHILSLDDYKTHARLNGVIMQYLKIRESIIIDNTNLARADRLRYTRLLDSLGLRERYIVRIVQMDQSMESSYHGNCYRYYKNYKSSGKYIPLYVYKMMRKRYDEIDQDEADVYDIANPGYPVEIEYFMRYA